MDATTSQTIFDGDQKAILKFTNVSDGTGETAVTKVTASSLRGAPTQLLIERIEYDVGSMKVEILWGATTDVVAYIVSNGQYKLDMAEYGGISNNAGAGKTGNIKFTTIGAAAGSTYAITLTLRKVGNTLVE